MRTDTIRAAAVQIAPDLSGRAGTMERVLNAIADAADKGAQLIVFPETFVPYYPYFSFVLPPVQQGAPHLKLYEEAVVVPSAETAAVADAARRREMVVVLGVNERDHGSLYNAQLIFDADGTLALKRRKITPTYHERMIWGQGDGSGLKVVDTAVGRVGALACWEHYNPLARYALMAQHEEIHAAHFPGSLVGPIFGEQIEVTMRHHALESGCFVVNATGWLTRRADRRDPSRPKAAEGPARRLHDLHRLAGGPPSRAAADRGRGHPDRRSRHAADHQAQADDGFGRPLRPAGAPVTSSTTSQAAQPRHEIGDLWCRIRAAHARRSPVSPRSREDV